MTPWGSLQDSEPEIMEGASDYMYLVAMKPLPSASFPVRVFLLPGKPISSSGLNPTQTPTTRATSSVRIGLLAVVPTAVASCPIYVRSTGLILPVVPRAQPGAQRMARKAEHGFSLRISTEAQVSFLLIS